MAKNGSKGNGRIGSVKSRTQVLGPNGFWVKRNTATGQFMDQKTSSKTPFKGVKKEN